MCACVCDIALQAAPYRRSLFFFVCFLISTELNDPFINACHCCECVCVYLKKMWMDYFSGFAGYAKTTTKKKD